jgi:prophage regulatory protein
MIDAKLQRIHRLPAVEEFTGLGKSAIYVGVNSGDFPAPIQLGSKSVGWLESDLLAWQAKQIAARDSGKQRTYPNPNPRGAKASAAEAFRRARCRSTLR